MSNDRCVGLVAVGVDHTGDLLVDLKGAGAGAKRLAGWLEKQREFGVVPEIKVLTDEAGVVRARDVQVAAKQLVDAGGLNLLILYFSGHGIVKSGSDEQVLLSEVKTFADEAISVASTALNARYLGIPHVVIISDACRSAVDPYSWLGQVSGKPAVFRGAVIGVKPGKVDVFYATEPSQTAKEHKGDGFFTKVFLDALDNSADKVSEEWAGSELPVITTWGLEDYLYKEVPLRAQKETPRFEQTPDIIVTAREPLFFAYRRKPPVGLPAPALSPGPNDGSSSIILPSPPYGNDESRWKTWQTDDFRTAGEKLAGERFKLDIFHSDFSTSVSPDKTRRGALDAVSKELWTWESDLIPEDLLVDAGLLEDVKKYVGTSAARRHYETGTGFSVVGADVDKVLVGPNEHAELFLEEGSGRTDIRFLGNVAIGTSPSALVILKTKTMFVLPVMPGYIGTVQVSDGLVSSVSLDLNERDRCNVSESPAGRVRFDQRRAVAAAFASAGKLRKLAGDAASLFAMVTRESKLLDPTLGVYAAYAYALAGDDEGPKSIYNYMSQYQKAPRFNLRSAPVPFDVAMLANMLGKSDTLLAPFCPMMSLGWSLIDSYAGEFRLHPAVYEAGKRRLNAEWTTFTVESSAALIEAFSRGEIL